MTITVDTTDRRDGKALALFARCAEWQQGRTKDGRSFFAIPGSERGLLHMTDTRDCSCADRQRSRNLCKHMRAVRLWMVAYQTGAVAPKPRPAATLEDERITLTPAGAEYLANLPSAPADTDGSRAYLAKLQAEQSSHAATLRAHGRDPEGDHVFRQRAEWIAGLESRHARETRDSVPVRSRRTVAELLAVE